MRWWLVWREAVDRVFQTFPLSPVTNGDIRLAAQGGLSKPRLLSAFNFGFAVMRWRDRHHKKIRVSANWIASMSMRVSVPSRDAPKAVTCVTSPV